MNLNFIENRNYQKDIINTTLNYFKYNDKCILNMCCGSGKTITSLLIMEAMNINKVLILVPSKIILNQWINVVNHKINKNINYYDNEIHYNSNFGIYISLYHNAHKINNTKFDLVILDECHHLCGDIKNKKAMSFMKTFNIYSVKQLGLTATLRTINIPNYISNSNVDYFGNIIINKNIKWGIENNIITDFKIQMAIMNDNYNMNIDKLYLSVLLALKNLNLNISKHILIYCNTIKNAKKIIMYITDLLNANYFNNIINKFTYFDYTSKSDKHNINLFNDDHEMSIISTVYSLGEGFDMPKLDTVIFSENMSSDIRIVQSILRPCRKYKNKENALIVLPILCNNNKSDINDFKKIKKIIRSISNCDINDSEYFFSKICIYKMDLIQSNYCIDNINIIKYNHKEINKLISTIITTKNKIMYFNDPINDFLNNQFNFSKIKIFNIGNKKYQNIHNRRANIILYETINDIDLIYKFTTLGKRTLYNYIENNDLIKKHLILEQLQLVFRGIDNNSSIKELLFLSSKCKIPIELSIELKNKDIIHYKSL